MGVEINPYVLIFCSGAGTRMGKLTEKTPKPLLPIHKSQCLLELNIKQLLGVGLTNFFINYSYGYSLFLEVKEKLKDKCHIELCEDNKNGQGNFIKEVINNVGCSSKFITLNGDTFFDLKKPDVEKILEINEPTVVTSFLNSSKSLIVDSYNKLVGYRGNRDYLYKVKVDNLAITYKGYIGINSFTTNSLILINRFKRQNYYGLFGVEDVFEQLIREGLTINTYDVTTMRNFITFNTEIEYLSAKKSLNDYFSF
jgi:NDP-sugar pyrophosphorylase family protein